MCQTEKAEKAEVAQEILAYLAENTEAQDTLEGIVEWWLLKQRIKRQLVTVKEALAELIARGLVIEHESKDSRNHYRINRRKARQIRALLNRESG